jgi:hypothetical protein
MVLSFGKWDGVNIKPMETQFYEVPRQRGIKRFSIENEKTCGAAV